MTESVGGPIYIGDAPAAETLPENDSTIDIKQIIKNTVVAAPITTNATVTVHGNLVVV